MLKFASFYSPNKSKKKKKKEDDWGAISRTRSEGEDGSFKQQCRLIRYQYNCWIKVIIQRPTGSLQRSGKLWIQNIEPFFFSSLSPNPSSESSEIREQMPRYDWMRQKTGWNNQVFPQLGESKNQQHQTGSCSRIKLRGV